MQLIDEIIDILSSEDSNLENALIKTKVLLHKMGEKSLLTWVNSELNGYAYKDNIPEYRIISAPLYATITNGYRRLRNQQLPLIHLESKKIEELITVELKESISSLYSFSNSDDTIKVDIQIEYLYLFSDVVNKGVHIESAYKYISHGQIEQVLSQIRNRLLDFLLELSEKLPNNKGEVDLKSESKKIKTEELFNHTIFGDNTTIIVGDKNTTNTTQLKNDIDALFETLKKYNISEKELTQLEKSIEKDTESGVKKYGKNVKDWLAKVSGKAIEKGTLDTMSGIGEAVTSFF